MVMCKVVAINSAVQAESILGRKLKVAEAVMCNLFGDAPEYVVYVNDSGNLAYKRVDE